MQENPSVRRKNNDLIQKKTQTNPVMGVSIPKVRRDPMKHMKKKASIKQTMFFGEPKSRFDFSQHWDIGHKP